MVTTKIAPPFPVFYDVDGQPLDAGYIYVGVANLEPTTNPIAVYWDEALTIPAAQPIQTINGYPSRAGTPSAFFSSSNYSILVRSNNGTLVYSSPSNFAGSLESDLANTSDPNLGDALVGVKSTLTGGVARTQHDKNADYISVKDFGAVGDGVTNDTSAFQSALAATMGKALYVPAGNYKIVSDLVCNGTQAIYGDGANQTQLTFAPTAPGALLTVTAGTSQTIVGNIRGLHLYSADTTHFKVALDIYDVSNFVIDDIYISGAGTGTPSAPYWSGASNTSMGLRTNGRETSTFSNLRICADKPIVIAANPNTAPADNEEADHFHFYNCYLVANSNYCVTVNDGYGVSNLTFDGYQAWVGGTGGFYLNDTRPGGSYIPNRNIVFRNVRTEQQNTGAAGGYTQPSTEWAYKISAATETQTISIEDCVMGNYSNGIYTSKAARLTLKNVVAAIATTQLQMANNTGRTTLEVSNCLFDPTGTVTLTNMVPSKITSYLPGSYSFPTSGTWVFTNTAPYANWTVIGKAALSNAAGAVTTEEILATVTLKANTMGPYGCLKVWTLWTCTNNANVKTARVRLGGIGGTDFLAGALASNATFVGETRIFNQNNVAAQVGTSLDNGGSASGVISAAINTAADTTIVITGQKATAGDTLTLVAYCVEVAAG